MIGFRPLAVSIASRLTAEPDRVALEWAGRSLTAGQLAGWSMSIAEELQAAGLTPGGRVAVATGRSAGMVASLLGVLSAGGVIVPLDRHLPAGRRRTMLDASGASLLVTVGDDELAGARPGVSIGEWPSRDLDRRLDAVPVGPYDAAYIFFTSGSTGMPKGVLGSQIGLASFMEWMAAEFAITTADRVSLLRSISFDASMREVFVPLLTGATLVLGPDPIDPDTAVEWIRDRRISILNATPSHAAVWLDAVTEPVPSSLRWVCFSGERLDPGLVDRWREVFVAPGQIANLYGPTETTMIRTFDVVAKERDPEPLPVGRPLPHSEVHVLRPDGSVCDVGEAGEVIIATDVGTLGYLDDREADRFIADPVGSRRGAYRTGDRGWLLDDGRLVVSGRLDDQVQILGVRVEPAEVTAALASHPSVDRAAVVAVPDPRTGHHLVAFVKLVDGAVADKSGWRAHLLDRVLGPAIPHRFELVDAFPLNSNGKIDRAALLARLQGAAPAPDAPAGPSVMPTAAPSRAERLAALSPAQRALLEARRAKPAPTLADRAGALADDQRRALIERLRAKAAPRAVVREAPLSFAQERLWFLEQLFPGRANYNIPRIFHLRGDLDVEALRAACDRIIARHEVLRTHLVDRDGEPVQVVSAPGPAPFELRELPGEDVDGEAVRAVISAECGRVFDLGTGPLWKVTVLRLAPDVHVMIFVTHHIVSDGWSLVPINREIAAGYAAARRGVEPDLPVLPIQYADYSIRQRAREAAGGFEADLDYWEEELRGAPELLTIPGSKVRPANPTLRGERIRFRFEQAPAEWMTQLARSHSATPFMVTLALYQAYLSRVTGERDLVVGIPSADRVEGDLQDMVGFFVNSLAMRAQVGEGATFREFLEQVRAAAVRSYDHREVPFEHVVRRLSPARATDRSPIFQVFFQFGAGEFNTPLELEGIDAQRLIQPTSRSKFDMTVYLGTQQGALGGSVVYNTELFDDATMQRFIDGFGAFCAAALSDPDRPLDDLPVAGAAVPRPAPEVPVVSEPSPGPAPVVGGDEEIARQIAQIWSDLLGGEVGIDDDFFELGGHSLLAIRVFSRVEAAFGRPLPIGAIFDAPTPRGLAALLDDEGAEEEPAEDPTPQATTSEISAPLSLAQQRLWFLDRLNPGSSSYHITWKVRLNGDLDVPAMQAALRHVVARHSVLRTRIVEVDGAPRQIADLVASDPLVVEDLSGHGSDAEAVLAARLTEEESRPFDLVAGPLLRARLFALAGDDHVLSVVVHHIVTDAESGRIFWRELAEFYSAAVEGRPARVAQLALQFSDIATRQRIRFTDDALLDAWTETLRGAPTVLDLAADRMRSTELEVESGSVVDGVGEDVVAAMRDIASLENASPFMVALSAFAVLVHRQCGEEDFLVGIPSTERTDPDSENLIGFFVNTLPIRMDLSGSPTFRELVRRVRQQVLFALSHRDVPLEAIVERMTVPRDASRNPLFQVVFDMTQLRRSRRRFAGLEPVPVGVESSRRAAKFDLRVNCGLGRRRMRTYFEYRSDLYEPQTIEDLAAQFSVFLTAALAEPDRPVGDLSMLTEAGRSFVDADRLPSPVSPSSLMTRFAEVVDRHRDDPAVVDGGLTVTYGRLATAASDVADRLRRLGIGPGFTVGVSMPRSAALVAAVLGVLEVGAAYVPLDPGYPPDRLAAIEDDAGVAAVLSADATGPLGVTIEIAKGTAPVVDAGTAYVMYTSGSTGTPKGVVVPERAIWRLVVDPDYVTLGPGDVVAFASNTAFDAATFEIWGALLNGARLLVLGRDTLISPDALAAELRNGEVTTMFMTTALFKAVVARRPDAFATLRDLLFGGEAADVTAVRRCLAAGPPQRLVNAYGPTETTTFALTHVVESVPADARTIPIGRPIGGTSARVVSPSGVDVPVGAPGELVLGGPGVAAGYLGDPELTAARFRRRADGMVEYWTGDRVRRRVDGSIEYLGRFDRQVKMRGYRIEPGEIEAHLTAHGSVREAVVLHRNGDVGARLIGYVVAEGDPAPAAELLDHLGRRLPAFMVPTAIVTVDSFPRTPNGKLDAAALPDPTVESAPYVEPTGDAMVQMARLWCDVLDVEQVGANDDFFALGGHSLLAIKLFATIEEVFGKAEPLSTLFEAPTLAAMTARIAGQGPLPQPDAVPSGVVVIRSGGTRTPVFCLPPAGGNVMVYEPMARAFEGERTVYGVQAPGVDGRREPLRTIEALAEHCERLIVATHPSGPYVLVGYSMGGLIAWEVARRLRAGGHQVDLLGLIDARLPRRMSARDRVRTDLDIVRRYKLDGARLIGMRVARSIRSAAGAVRHGPAMAIARWQGRDLDPIQAGRRLTAAGLEATQAFEPQPYAGPAFYFRAESVPGPWGRGGVGRWRRVATGGLEVVELPGTHKGLGSVMHDPNAAVLAKEIHRIIERGESQ